jgi:hypothetical protein
LRDLTRQLQGPESTGLTHDPLISILSIRQGVERLLR